MTGYRTLIAAAVVAALGALQGLDWVTLVTNPKAFGWTAAGLGIVMAVFRAITSTPVGGSPPSA